MGTVQHPALKVFLGLQSNTTVLGRPLVVTYSPDRTQVVTCWDSAIRIWDAVKGQPIGPYSTIGKPRGVRSVTFSPGGVSTVPQLVPVCTDRARGQIDPAARQLDFVYDGGKANQFGAAHTPDALPLANPTGPLVAAAAARVPTGAHI